MLNRPCWAWRDVGCCPPPPRNSIATRSAPFFSATRPTSSFSGPPAANLSGHLQYFPRILLGPCCGQQRARYCARSRDPVKNAPTRYPADLIPNFRARDRSSDVLTAKYIPASAMLGPRNASTNRCCSPFLMQGHARRGQAFVIPPFQCSIARRTISSRWSRGYAISKSVAKHWCCGFCQADGD